MSSSLRRVATFEARLHARVATDDGAKNHTAIRVTAIATVTTPPATKIERVIDTFDLLVHSVGPNTLWSCRRNVAEMFNTSRLFPELV
jgi:predicted component of type VI protein secretion system